ncbi:hypothetical protein KI440_02680 [Candidatus Saccharibacteria bacterium TM7i]|nr:hypothetical protein KI440_02680 [Candidatus Saccharibacteria bacterium TM7i]
MEFLKLVRKKSFFSELTYALLNMALAIAVTLIVYYTSSILLAMIAVIISKWRVFAVRPRYWWANLRSNMVDFTVSASVVLHMYGIHVSNLPDSSKLPIMIALTILYIGWLLFLKPRSKRSYVIAQAGVAIFLGSTALFTTWYDWPVSIVVLGMWINGFTATQHALSAYEKETHAIFLSLVWGFVIAEISWVAYHWAVAYPLPLLSGVMIPQVSIIVTLLSFLAFKVYNSLYMHDKVRSADVLMPLLFTVGIILVLLVAFTRVGVAI